MIALVILAFLALMLFFKGRWLGFKAFRKRKLMYIQIVLLLAMVVEALVVLGSSREHRHYIRVMRIFRPVFFISSNYSAGVRRLMREIAQCAFTADPSRSSPPRGSLHTFHSTPHDVTHRVTRNAHLSSCAP
jgi:hypothetical protein